MTDLNGRKSNMHTIIVETVVVLALLFVMAALLILMVTVCTYGSG